MFGAAANCVLAMKGPTNGCRQFIGNSTVLPTVSGTTGDIRGQYQLEDTDDPVVPRSPSRLLLYSKWFHVNPGGPGGFPLAEVQSKHVFRLSKLSSVFLNVAGGTKTYRLPNGPEPPNLPTHFAGGLLAKTIFGPVKIGGAVGAYGRGRFFFQIGRVF
jgi:hypothetical protein